MRGHVCPDQLGAVVALPRGRSVREGHRPQRHWLAMGALSPLRPPGPDGRRVRIIIRKFDSYINADPGR